MCALLQYVASSVHFFSVHDLSSPCPVELFRNFSPARTKDVCTKLKLKARLSFMEDF